MGNLLLANTPRWEPTELVDPDAAGPVGSERARSEPTLTEVIVDGRHRVQYGAELGGIRLWRDRPLRIDLRKSSASGQVTLTTLEIEDVGRRYTGWTAVTAFR